MKEYDSKEANGRTLGKIERSRLLKSKDKFSKEKFEMCPLDFAIRRA